MQTHKSTVHNCILFSVVPTTLSAATLIQYICVILNLYHNVPKFKHPNEFNAKIELSMPNNDTIKLWSAMLPVEYVVLRWVRLKPMAYAALGREAMGVWL